MTSTKKKGGSKAAGMDEVTDWERQLERCKVTAGAMGGRKQVHYTFPDGTEMVEEYDLAKDNLLIRRWKRKTALGKAGGWEFELGEDYAPASASSSGSAMIQASSSNPVCVRHDTEKAFCWRVRNIPYPADTYKLTVEDNKIVLRTTNKK
ncbi:hypothetical protein PTSG_03809 [Salpingoeca rosetta]|uniref:Protein DPCD n=1 Tax=Salpingoeca rosetta (strain ATCC 50818 / BSB-021) TaxID=946362 RepID=F2U5G2_SALR5|nr:uncharacterized protein PTSG_03809 [Salpingoeca rosetta]EGD83178.1 hypothetical protein PTSG_03809 [Salpingoeca rosetta]|eukprot:XP_004995542.1 hypothetical protein PTSG_03809 [Salpingoeca rosetta]